MSKCNEDRKELFEIINLVEENIKNNKYISLELKKSKIIRNYYEEKVKFLNLENKNIHLFVNSKKLSNGYNRIVIGDYGAYIEILPEQILLELQSKKGQEWRLKKKNQEKYYIKYIWYNIDDIKIYYQLRTVKYADYKINMYYISPFDVEIKE